MLCMVSYPHRLKSGHIMCYLNRTYHVPTTCEHDMLKLFDNVPFTNFIEMSP